MMMMGVKDESRSEIVFFDLETTVPTRPGLGFAILEFGAILVCPRKLVELHSYSTLVRPANISLINSLSVRCNGITPDAVSSAPTFAEIADTVFDILHGRIWAGHNILRFDCVRIREAFAELGRAAPEPKGTIDSLALLTQRFGRRAGDMKMSSLATYFGLGQQTHRSLDDVRMNLEVVKNCAAVLFLESSLPDIFTENSWVSPNAVTRSRSNGKASPNGSTAENITPTSGQNLELDTLSTPITQKLEEKHPIHSLMTTTDGGQTVDSETGSANPFDMGSLSNQIIAESLQVDEQEESAVSPSSEGSSSGCSGFLDPGEVSLALIAASHFQYYRGTQRIKLLHKDEILQLCCSVKVRFGATRGKYVDFSGRPKLSFVANASPVLCQVLDACDAAAQKLSVDSGSSSEWKPVVIRKEGFVNFPTIRLHIPTIYADSPRYETEIYKKGSSGALEKLVFSQSDEASEMEALITSGMSLEVYFSLDHYDYQESAGIRLVAKKLVLHS